MAKKTKKEPKMDTSTTIAKTPAGHPVIHFEKLPQVLKGFKRGWYRCRTCNRVQYRDYQPYSLSHPIMVPVCGHGIGERDYGLITISEDEARRLAAPTVEVHIRFGMRLARAVFQKRGNHTEMHLRETELAAMLATAFEEGMKHPLTREGETSE